MCRIVLEDIPGVLRIVFRDEISHKYKQKWIDGQKCGKWLLQQERFRSRITPTWKSLLASGLTNEWDITLLVYVLLYSSQLLLADSFHDNQVGVKHNDPNKLVSSSPQADFTRHLHRNDIILCDFGQELMRNEVKYVSQKEISLKYQIKTQSPPQITVYRCSNDWVLVEELSKLRNAEFAHCKNARISTPGLKSIVQRVKTLYTNLRITKQRIDSMTDIVTGMCTVIHVRICE